MTPAVSCVRRLRSKMTSGFSAPFHSDFLWKNTRWIKDQVKRQQKTTLPSFNWESGHWHGSFTVLKEKNKSFWTQSRGTILVEQLFIFYLSDLILISFCACGSGSGASALPLVCTPSLEFLFAGLAIAMSLTCVPFIFTVLRLLEGELYGLYPHSLAHQLQPEFWQRKENVVCGSPGLAGNPLYVF